MDWAGATVLVTGGASFIGSRLTEHLVDLGARVIVADNLSRGRVENIASLLDCDRVRLVRCDLREFAAAREVTMGVDTVFHLAANHGGREYIATHQADCAGNLALDGTVIRAACDSAVQQFVFASSGCVYPSSLQTDPSREIYLDEALVQRPYDADQMYGWAKLMAERTLRAYHEERGMRSAVCRYFTVYGPRGGKSHAVHAMIARAFAHQDPFDIWGDGTLVRNWTYVDDIVRGTVLAAERIEDGSAVNLGTQERITVLEAARRVCAAFGYAPEFRFLRDMPTGPLKRSANNARARALLGWAPETSFADGLAKTIDWYCRTNHRSASLAWQPRTQ
jgi:nucleoside-diphosphate-sugar epimerase